MRVRASLTTPVGRTASGHRTFDAQGIARFDSLPAGEGTITLEWLPPLQYDWVDRDWLPVLSRPLTISPGTSEAVSWDLGAELAVVDLTLTHTPEFATVMVVFFYHAPQAPGAPRGKGAGWSLKTFAPMRLPLQVCATMNAVMMSKSNAGWSGTVLLDSWSPTTPGIQQREIRFPDGVVEVKLTGSPPQGDPDWSRSILRLEAEPHTTAQLKPLHVSIREDGTGTFPVMAPGAYFLHLAWSADGDRWSTVNQVTRRIQFDGGRMRVDFAVSGTGGLEIQPPPPPGADLTPQTRASAPLRIRCQATAEERTIPWPEAGGITVADLPVGLWVAATWRGNLQSSAIFEIEPGRVTRLALPEWALEIPVRIRWEGRASELDPRLWIVDARGGYSDPVGHPDLGLWSGALIPGPAQVVILPEMGPRRVISFEVPAVLKDGDKFFEVVVPVGG